MRTRRRRTSSSARDAFRKRSRSDEAGTRFRRDEFHRYSSLVSNQLTGNPLTTLKLQLHEHL